MIMIITTTTAAITHVDMPPLPDAGVAVTSGLIVAIGVGVGFVVGAWVAFGVVRGIVGTVEFTGSNTAWYV